MFPWEFASLSELDEKWRNPWHGVDGVIERHQYINRFATLPWLERKSLGEYTNDEEQLWWQAKIRQYMVAPEDTGFLKACREAVSVSGHQSTLAEWLGGKSPLNNIVQFSESLLLFRLYLECANALGSWTWLNGHPNERTFDEFVDRTVDNRASQESRMLRNLPRNFWIDLRHQLLHPRGEMRPGRIEESVGILLISTEGEGKMATLVFEAVDTANEEGCLYPSPTVALVRRDGERDGFLESEEHAEAAVAKMGWPTFGGARPYDVRWSLQPRPPDWLPTAIKGPSASAAQGLLLAKIAARAGSLK